MRLLGELLTATPVRQIDALFDDRGVVLGPEQPRENDESVRRERMRRYLATLDLNGPVDALRLTSVLGDVLQTIIQKASTARGSNNGLRDKWVQILREDGFAVDETTGTVPVKAAAGAQLTEHALDALPDPHSIHDHLRRLADSVGIDHRPRGAGLGASAAGPPCRRRGSDVMPAHAPPWSSATAMTSRAASITAEILGLISEDAAVSPCTSAVQSAPCA